MAKLTISAGVKHILKGTIAMVLVASSSLSASESQYSVGLRQSNLLNADEGLVEGDSQEQLRQLKQAFFRSGDGARSSGCRQRLDE